MAATNKKYSIEKEENIIKLYLEGKSQKELGIMYNTSNTAIRRVLLRNNISIRGKSYAQSTVNDNIFEGKDKEDIMYWLGMLAADGCITKQGRCVVLELSEKDIDSIHQFKEFVDFPVNINRTVPKRGQPLYRISFMNAESANYLIDCGISPNKSLTYKFLKEIDINYLRGIFDGDGHFTITGKNNTQGVFGITTGSEECALQLHFFLSSLGFHPTIVKNLKDRLNPLFTVSMYRKQELIKLYSLLYKDAKYFLKRKYLKFGSFVEKFTNDNTLNSGKAKASDNPELADDLVLSHNDNHRASVETLQSAPTNDSYGEEKVQVEENHCKKV